MKRNPSRQRQSIRQANPATKRMTAAWKDTLKRKCIERTRQKRNNQIAQKRFSRFPADTIDSSRGSNDEQGENSMMMMMGMESAEETEEARGMTRNLIAEQLHATGLSIVPRPVIRSTSTPHNQMMYEYSTSGKSNRTFGNNGNALQGFGTGATIGCKTNGYPSEGGKETDEGDYCVTEDEFQALIDEIEAELEDDYEQQMQIFQAEEEENQLMINDQIEAYESFESQNTRETMGAQDIVNCPLCHAGLLRMDPSKPGDFYCELVGNTTPDIQCCKFATGAQFGVHMSLSELKSRLMMAYVKHTTICTGSLQFDLSGVGLVAGCSKCMKTEIIAPAQPVRCS